MQKEWVILVDESGKEIGQAEKMQAHKEALLHSAFSVVIFNSNNEMLLQQRAMNKYHTPGLWTNACCSHPRPGEELADAVQRRLMEELGFVTEASALFSFTYKFLDEPTGLWEHEFDTVFLGKYDGTIQYNPKEVMGVQWKSLADLKIWIEQAPDLFTFWFKTFLPRLEEELGGRSLRF